MVAGLVVRYRISDCPARRTVVLPLGLSRKTLHLPEGKHGQAVRLADAAVARRSEPRALQDDPGRQQRLAAIPSRRIERQPLLRVVGASRRTSASCRDRIRCRSQGRVIHPGHPPSRRPRTPDAANVRGLPSGQRPQPARRGVRARALDAAAKPLCRRSRRDSPAEGAAGDANIISFTGYGTWSKDSDVHAVNVQVSNAPNEACVSIQVDDGQISKVHTKPPFDPIT